MKTKIKKRIRSKIKSRSKIYLLPFSQGGSGVSADSGRGRCGVLLGGFAERPVSEEKE
jgi:hypothetical protein